MMPASLRIRNSRLGTSSNDDKIGELPGQDYQNSSNVFGSCSSPAGDAQFATSLLCSRCWIQR